MTPRSIARLSASVPSRHTRFSVAFTTNIAESNFRYTQVFASDFPFDAEGGAYLVRETVRAIDDLNLQPSVKAAIHRDNLKQLLTPMLN
jgi:hypothetical protein